MAKGTKGKKSLTETMSEEQLVYTDEEVGNVPFFILDEKYGIAVDTMSYMLVEKKQATRGIKDESGNVSYAEVYNKWDSISYHGHMKNVIISYCHYKNMDLNQMLKKSKDIRDLLNNQKKVEEYINTAFSFDGINKKMFETSDIIESKENLMKELQELQTLKNTLVSECNSLIELIKDKRKIIISETEPKKHRLKLEE